MSKEALVALVTFMDSCHDDWGEDGAWRTLTKLRDKETSWMPPEHQGAHKEFLHLDHDTQFQLVYEALGVVVETSTQVLPHENTQEQLFEALRLLGIRRYEQNGKLVLSKLDLTVEDLESI